MVSELDRSNILVCVVDDEDVVRESMRMLVETQGVRVKDFSNCIDFLEDPDAMNCHCLILDVRLPGISGLQLQERLNRRPRKPPIIFVSGHADVPMAVDAMRSGAVDFLQKPFPEQLLLDRVEQAIDLAVKQKSSEVRRATIQARLSQLTTREREVLDRMVSGLANKVIADQLDISVKTVEHHRARVMEKMRARSLAEVVQDMEWLKQQS